MVTAEKIMRERRSGSFSIPPELEKPKVTHIHGGHAYEIYRVTRENKKPLQLRAYPFEGYAGYDVLDASKQIRSNIQPSKKGREVEVVFVREYDPKTNKIGVEVGVMTQTIVDIKMEDQNRKVLDIGVKAIDPRLRDQGIGTQFLRDALLEHNGITDVSGQSRNGRVFSYLETVRDEGFIGEIRGYETPLLEEDLKVLERFLSKTKYKKVSDKEVSQLRRGLCLGIYPEADPELFIAPRDNPKAVTVVARLEELGVKPGGVNGLRYLASVNQEVVEINREEYARTETIASAMRRSWYLEQLGQLGKRIGRLLGLPH